MPLALAAESRFSPRIAWLVIFNFSLEHCTPKRAVFFLLAGSVIAIGVAPPADGLAALAARGGECSLFS